MIEEEIKDILQDVSMFDPEYSGEQMMAKKGTKLILTLIQQENDKYLDGFVKPLVNELTDTASKSTQTNVQANFMAFTTLLLSRLEQYKQTTKEQK